MCSVSVCVCHYCPMLKPQLRATPDGFINRPQTHLFTRHAHHHLPLTIYTPQPSKCKSQAALAPAGLWQRNLMEHRDPSFLLTPTSLLSFLSPALLLITFPLRCSSHATRLCLSLSSLLLWSNPLYATLAAVSLSVTPSLNRSLLRSLLT